MSGYVPLRKFDTGSNTQRATIESVIRGVCPPGSLTYSIVTDRKIIEALTPRITDLKTETGQVEDVTLTPEFFINKNEPGSALTLVLLGQNEGPRFGVFVAL